MKIVLCGSKKFIPKIFEVSEKLQEMGFETVIPREFIYEMTKKDASIRHFSEIEKCQADGDWGKKRRYSI